MRIQKNFTAGPAVPPYLGKFETEVSEQAAGGFDGSVDVGGGQRKSAHADLVVIEPERVGGDMRGEGRLTTATERGLKGAFQRHGA